MRRARNASGVHHLVIGYGNTLHRDDAVGRLLAEEIAGWLLPDVRVISTHQLVVEIADEIAGAERVLFIDASLPSAIGANARLKPLCATPSCAAASTHFVAPSDLIALAIQLYDASAQGWLLTMPGVDFAIGAGLSETAQESLAQGRILARNWLEAA